MTQIQEFKPPSGTPVADVEKAPTAVPDVAPTREQDFVKGWPHPEMLTQPKLKQALAESFMAFLNNTQEFLQYGDDDHEFMLGTPVFRKTLADFLANQYDRPCDWHTIMTTSGASMGADVIYRQLLQSGDYVVCEAPTYFAAHEMMRDRGLNLLDVGVKEDGMDLDALEQLLNGEHKGKIKLVYTIPVNHNPTGVTMTNANRDRLMKLAKEHDFKILADECYQLLSFTPSGVVPLFYHDDPSEPRVLSVNTFSKLLGPGTKVGWVQAHPQLLEPLVKIGWIDSGNNPAIMSSGVLNHFVGSGAFDRHLAYTCETLKAKKDLLVSELCKVGLEPNDPQGGYFVWVKSKGKRTGRSGKGMSLTEDEFSDYMRLCFAWLTDEQIIEGVKVLSE